MKSCLGLWGSCGLLITWRRGKPADICKDLSLKLDCLAETQSLLSGRDGLEETHKLQGGTKRKKSFRCFCDLRDKQVKGAGVGGLRRHWGVAPVQKDKVPVEKEWGPQHRVRDSRSQVESSNLQSIKTQLCGRRLRDGQSKSFEQVSYALPTSSTCI